MSATVLAAADGRAPWTAFVAVSTGGLATAVVASERAATRPEREARARARHDAAVAEILGRYERGRAARERGHGPGG